MRLVQFELIREHQPHDCGVLGDQLNRDGLREALTGPIAGRLRPEVEGL
jgi:hypothetical protein